MAQIAEHQIQVSEVLGSILNGVTFYCWIVLFSRGKESHANIAINANFGSVEGIGAMPPLLIFWFHQ